ncbi:hypothetical protein Aduo_017314 [Ancylostoma duodenale]
MDTGIGLIPQAAVDEYVIPDRSLVGPDEKKDERSPGQKKFEQVLNKMDKEDAYSRLCIEFDSSEKVECETSIVAAAPWNRNGCKYPTLTIPINDDAPFGRDVQQTSRPSPTPFVVVWIGDREPPQSDSQVAKEDAEVSYLRLSCLARDLGHIYESSVWFKEAMSVHQNNAGSWSLIGNLHMSKNEWCPGQKKFEQVLNKMDKEDAYLWVSLGNLWMELFNFGKLVIR